MSENAYVAKCGCGGIVMACATDRKSTAAKEVAECIRQGYEITQMTCEEVRTSLWCKNHGKCPPSQRPLFPVNTT